MGNLQGYLNLKGYGKFDPHDRPSGYNVWLTFAISPAAPTPPTPKTHMFRKWGAICWRRLGLLLALVLLQIGATFPPRLIERRLECVSV